MVRRCLDASIIAPIPAPIGPPNSATAGQTLKSDPQLPPPDEPAIDEAEVFSTSLTVFDSLGSPISYAWAREIEAEEHESVLVVRAKVGEALLIFGLRGFGSRCQRNESGRMQVSVCTSELPRNAICPS